ncbi:MAG TPA: MarR family transcriptional regulator [Clostridia bacterium]|nr:MarR family transcriptional regulator [Clostridia bacterium]
MNLKYRDVAKKMAQLRLAHRCYFHQSVTSKVYPGQPPILEYLLKNDNCTQKELADFLSVSPASIATSIKRMQKNGLVQKLSDARDLRYNRIKITQKGRDVFSQYLIEFEKINEKLFKGFSMQELDQLYGYLSRMTDNLDVNNIKKETLKSFNL